MVFERDLSITLTTTSSETRDTQMLLRCVAFAMYLVLVVVLMNIWGKGVDTGSRGTSESVVQVDQVVGSANSAIGIANTRDCVTPAPRVIPQAHRNQLARS